MSISGRFVRTVALPLTASLGLVAQVVAQAPQFPPTGTAEYTVTTDNKVDVANFNPEPFTGIVFDTNGRAYIVNPYGSTVVVYSSITPAPDLTIPTGLNPVSVGVWEPEPDLPDEWLVLVACNGTHGLFMHSAVDGRILNYLQLDSEPADLVIDQENDQAFVSCQGDNTVVQVDLATFKVATSYTLTCGVRAGPLYLDRGDPNEKGDEHVFVAAAVTGNNTVPLGPGGQAAGVILNLDNNLDGGLPDEDVFCIDPATQTIAPVIKRAGSLIFDIDRNPITGEMWILSTDSINDDSTLDTEPKLRGKFAINQLIVRAGVPYTSPAVSIVAGTEIDLDDVNPDPDVTEYDVATSVNQARTIAFGHGGYLQGYAFIASAQSDVLIAVDPNGVRVRDFKLPAGAQCYDVEVWNLVETLVVCLCMGTQTIEVFDWSSPQSGPAASVPLGLDPTPDQIRRGRNVFLDGTRSKDGRFSCATCHPRGMTDVLAWPLRGDPTDEKDIMLTQSLLSIADTYPHHWRGERALVDFKKAFGGLLGAPPDKVPTVSEMEDFMVYVRSLQAPANPVQNYLRVIDDSRGTTHPDVPAGSPVAGQQAFEDVANFNGQTCAGCHASKSGTDAAHIFEVIGTAAPRTTSLEVAHLRQLQHRGFDTVDINLGGPNDHKFNRNGYGATHNGVNPSLFTFVTDNIAFDALSEDEQIDTVRFVEQFDQGISPAVHWAGWFDQDSVSTTNVIQEIETILLGGAGRGWNDVVAIGRFNAGSGLVPVRWLYAAGGSNFESDTPGIGPISWTRMKDLTSQGKAENVFIGLPLANGQRFGLDHDRDGLLNGSEAGEGTSPWDPDYDNDGWPDGYETLHDDDPLAAQATSSDAGVPADPSYQFDFANSRLAKYHVRFREDVTYEVKYWTSGGPVRTFHRDYYTTADTFVLTHEEPSTPDFNYPGTPITLDFQAEIKFWDRNGNLGGPFTLTPFQPTNASKQLLFVHVKGMEWESESRSNGTLTAEVRIKIDFNYGAPDFDVAEVANQMVFSNLAVKLYGTDDFVKASNFTSSEPREFLVGFDPGDPTPQNPNPVWVPPELYTVDPGPYWVTSTLTDSNGETVVNFALSGLNTGDEVQLSVMGILARLNYEPDPDLVAYDGASGPTMQPLLLENTMEIKLTY